ncbi:photosystem reaction center subunit H [Nostocales cyanobacterium HT-58-2]|nr:photosystem reaction center subunit H [Nostocales cyanobacterium HT-58-2]
MALVKLRDFYLDDREDNSDIDEIKNYDVYAGNDKVGSVYDLLVDEQTGRFRYFVVDTGFWIFGKKVLLPVGLANIDHSTRRINVNSLSRDQVENLPNYDDLERVDFDYEEQVRNAYRPMAASSGITQPTYDRNTYNYEQEPSLYNISDRDDQTLRLYEERLIANKERRKTGEVAIGKHIETETARVAVPLEKERVVIERTTPTDVTPVHPTDADFREGEVARMEIYEETPDIHKEAVVREEVRVKKVVEQDTAEATETIRREELDVDAPGLPIVDKQG